VKTPEYGLGTLLVIAGALLAMASRRIAAITDPLNERITRRKYRDARGYVLVGIGIIIVGLAIAFGFA